MSQYKTVASQTNNVQKGCFLEEHAPLQHLAAVKTLSWYKSILKEVCNQSCQICTMNFKIQ